MNEGRVGTDGKRRPPLPPDELINELRPHGRGFAWLRWLIFWRIGIGDIVLFVGLIAAIVLGQVQDSHRRGELRAQAARSNAQSARTTAALRAQAARADTRAARTTAALCALRHDLEKRVVQSQKDIVQSQKFLAQHPEGFAGIPAAAIRQNLMNQRQGLVNQQHTIDALSSLSC